ncbi:GTP 3',8-cyclase MoaA [Myxococcota bacterium]|nr:GTP 3',8-cyclase MoaA [Myxococcota bacterium]MCZ7617711.1 GTP 3',8-cyclase MoaA [Myxococcota bacterium]
MSDSHVPEHLPRPVFDGVAPESALVDGWARRIESLRISVTDRCNFRCVYCIPEQDIEWLPKGELATLEELARITRVAVGCGVKKLRVTGGEPLLRKNLPNLIREVAKLPGLEDLALTTNGTELPRLAGALRAAGLERVNVSLDSLDPATFAKLAQRDALADVLAGIDAAEAAGLVPISVNCVVLRGVNDGEAVAFARFARERGFEVRFIEFMPLEHGQRWGTNALVPGHELRARVEQVFPLRPAPDQDPHAPSRDWVFADGAPGRMGFIDSVTAPFCASCNRIRLTADGKLRTCLFSLREHDLLGPMRAGLSDAELADRLRAAVTTKELKHHISDGLFVKPERTMSQIGG